MNRYVKYVLEDIRQDTDDEGIVDEVGYSDSIYLRYLNDAQYKIQALIQKKYPMVFVEQIDKELAAKEFRFKLPKDAFLGNKVIDVKYSAETYDASFFRLEPSYLSRINRKIEGIPREYIRKSGYLELYPKPSDSGILRLNYVKRIPKLALRAAEVGTVKRGVTEEGEQTVFSFELDGTVIPVDYTTLEKYNRYTVVDKDGNIKASELELNIDENAGEVAVVGGLDPEENIELGDYLLPGGFSSTHSALDESLERYLVTYTTIRVLESKGDNMKADKDALLASIEKEIIDTYADIKGDFHTIPIIIQPEDDWD